MSWGAQYKFSISVQDLQRDIEKHSTGVASVLNLCEVLLHDCDACATETECESIQQATRGLDRRWRNICAVAMERRLKWVCLYCIVCFYCISEQINAALHHRIPKLWTVLEIKCVEMKHRTIKINSVKKSKVESELFRRVKPGHQRNRCESMWCYWLIVWGLFQSWLQHVMNCLTA